VIAPQVKVWKMYNGKNFDTPIKGAKVEEADGEAESNDEE
jgi:uncharacterized protein YprB with RNaseH-like and TPR domain